MGLEMCAEAMGDSELVISSFVRSKCVPLYLAFKFVFCKLLFIMYKHVCVFACKEVYVCASVFRAIGILYLRVELQTVMSHLTWML